MPVFHRLPAPGTQTLEALIQTIRQRVGADLEREGLLVRDIENTYLQLETADESALNDLLGHSITYRIAAGLQAGRQALTLQTVPAREQYHNHPNRAKSAGFSLHAGVAAKAHQRRKLERLCRYNARPAVATDRLALTPQGNVRYDVKGFTNVAGSGMRRSDHPKNAVPGRHHAHHPGTTRLHRMAGCPGAKTARESRPLRGPAKAQRLKRVFEIDTEICVHCGGENYFAKHAVRHDWWYYPAVTRGEVILIKQWDAAGGLARSGGEAGDGAANSAAPCTFSFHSAFSDSSTPSGAPERQSIEVRCVAIY